MSRPYDHRNMKRARQSAEVAIAVRKAVPEVLTGAGIAKIVGLKNLPVPAQAEPSLPKPAGLNSGEQTKGEARVCEDVSVVTPEEGDSFEDRSSQARGGQSFHSVNPEAVGGIRRRDTENANMKTPEQIQRIEKTFDTAKEVCKTLAPLTERAQRRLLTYFMDLCSDPDTDAGLTEGEVLKQVHTMLDLD